ncbi:uncharacterized protein LOC123199482 isoform X2 [Mangifera indica]|uniref:uncharacterized protein LOC123199482 isoform X2 n=1 Tax=Mangifera indica TaxID=29780 RepID=UPI001CF95FF2|nr:uncharacterized protein LOC123199482 isoform X2 [Mangifera indica]
MEAKAKATPTVKCFLKVRLVNYLLVILTAVGIKGLGAVAVAVPRSNCYAFDNSSRIVDFSSWIGHYFEYEDNGVDLVVRFCKDVETRSQAGYIAFGRFNKFNHFVAGSGHVDFVQGFYGGDLLNCESSYDKMGRTAQVNIICGNCLNGQCEGGLGCICNVTYESNCRVFVELAIPCEKPGPRVFKGFTVGFHPRSWEIVYDGMTQPGFEKARHDFSFKTEQTHVALYMTAIASVSTVVGKPYFEVFPEKGLKVSLSGSGAMGSPATTLSPTLLIVNWRCERARDSLYEVNITIPVKGYDPVQFFLTKMCEYRQDKEVDPMRGWAIFGVISCIIIVSSAIFCCGGFIYKTRTGQLVSGAGQRYSQPEGLNRSFPNQTSWERSPASAKATWRSNERNYGSI